MTSGRSQLDASRRRARAGRVFPGSELFWDLQIEPGTDVDGEVAFWASAGIMDVTVLFRVVTTASAAGTLFSVGSAVSLSVNIEDGDLIVRAGGSGTNGAEVVQVGFALDRLWSVSIAVRPATSTLWVWLEGRLVGRVSAPDGFPDGKWTDGVGVHCG